METEPLHHPIFVNSQQLDSGGNTISHESEIVFQLSCLALNICSLRIFPLIISNQVACFRKKKIRSRMLSKEYLQLNLWFSQLTLNEV